MRRSSLIWPVATVLGAVTTLAAWQQPSPSNKQQRPPQTPIFRSGIEVVQLDVSVIDRDRLPVRGLTSADFTVFEDGKARPIVGFSAFEMDESRPATDWMREIPADVTSNAVPPDGRLFVIVIDDALIPQEPAFIRDTKRIVTEIVEQLAPADLTAVVFTGDNRRSQDFTNNRQALLATLDKLNPGLAGYRFGLDTRGDAGPPRAPDPTLPPREPSYVDVDYWFYQSAIRTLGEVANHLIAVPGRRKALFWVSPGVPVDMMDCQPIRPGEEDPKQPPDLPKMCTIEKLPPRDTVRSSDVRYVVPLKTLPAGEYLLTLEAHVGVTTIRRDVRFKVQ